MGLLDTLRNALGFQRPLVPNAPDAPVLLSDAARQHLSTFPKGHGIHVSTSPVEGGRMVHVDEGPAQGPPPPELGEAPVTMSDEDLRNLRGLTLDWRDDRWTVSVRIELRGRETPNPDGRTYLADRWLAVGRPMFFSRGTAELPSLPARLLAIPNVKTVLLRDNTVTIEREPDASWDVLDRAVDASIREHFLLCGHELTAEEATPDRQDPLEAAVAKVLAERIAPAVHKDGGDIELVGISDGVVRVAMVGACRTCPSSTATLRMGVERTLLEAFPGQITRVEQV